MRTSGADGSVPTAEHLRRRAFRRRALVLAAVVVVLLQTASPAPAQVPGAFQARVCAALQGVQAAFPDSVLVRQTLAPFLLRFACGSAQPGTTAVTTSTTIHVDCPGGLCPTTTFTTFAPTTLPPGVTTIPQPTTTLPPCSSTTVTSTMSTSTTIPTCQP